MATANDLISAASLKIGVGSPTTAQNATALASLNNMITFWGTENLNYVVTSETLSIGTGGAEYTVGSGGDLNTVRPLGIEKCFLRDSNDYDWPVGVMSSDRYNRLSYKAHSMRPTQLYYLPEFPLAKIIFNSVPEATYTAYFEFRKAFTAFASTTTTIGTTANPYPVEDLEAIVYNLAVSLGEDWDRKVPLTVIARARETKDAIDARNAANKPVAKAKFDFDGGAPYNITTDT